MAAATQELVSPIHAGRTVTLKAFLASELPEDTRERVIEKYRWINVDYDWWGFILDDFISHMEEEYGAVLEKEDIVFDIDRGGYVKYRGDFGIDIGACMDKVETLREIYKRIEEAAIIDPETAREIKEAVDNMRIGYEYTYLGVSVEYDEAYHEDDDGDEWYDPFEMLAEILEDESCRSLPRQLEDELDAMIKEEFQNLLSDLEDEFERLISDEAVIETLDANGFLFTEDGEKIPGFYSKTAETDNE